jgi:hypothetical protein
MQRNSSNLPKNVVVTSAYIGFIRWNEQLELELLITKANKNKVVPTEHAINYLSLPGGRVERGERPINALVREVSEELGSSPCQKDLIDFGGWIDASKDCKYRNHLFLSFRPPNVSFYPGSEQIWMSYNTMKESMSCSEENGIVWKSWLLNAFNDESTPIYHMLENLRQTNDRPEAYYLFPETDSGNRYVKFEKIMVAEGMFPYYEKRLTARPMMPRALTPKEFGVLLNSFVIMPSDARKFIDIRSSIDDGRTFPLALCCA